MSRENPDDHPDEGRLLRVRGDFTADHLMFSPPASWLEEDVERLIDVVAEAVLRIRGAVEDDRFIRRGNIEDHVRFVLPSALLKPRAKALDKATAAVLAALAEERCPVRVYDYDPRTRTKTEVTP